MQIESSLNVVCFLNYFCPNLKGFDKQKLHKSSNCYVPLKENVSSRKKERFLLKITMFESGIHPYSIEKHFKLCFQLSESGERGRDRTEKATEFLFDTTEAKVMTTNIRWQGDAKKPLIHLSSHNQSIN